jgi:hypothetical protein
MLKRLLIQYVYDRVFLFSPNKVCLTRLAGAKVILFYSVPNFLGTFFEVFFKDGENSIIEVITTASKIPGEIGPEYVKAFTYLGANNVNVMQIERREQASEPEFLERLKKPMW